MIAAANRPESSGGLSIVRSPSGCLSARAPAGCLATTPPFSLGPPDCPAGARLIPLTQGFFAVVDDEDFERVSAFKWKAEVSRRAGKVYAAHLARRDPTPGRCSAGYAHVLMHRFILDAPPGIEVDHRDNNGLLNRRHNLRLATPQQNGWNRWDVKNATGFKGVSETIFGRFCARITCNDRRHYLGAFATAIEAALAYDEAAKLHFGEFARLNFPDGSDVTHALTLQESVAPCPSQKLPTRSRI